MDDLKIKTAKPRAINKQGKDGQIRLSISRSLPSSSDQAVLLCTLWTN